MRNPIPWLGPSTPGTPSQLDVAAASLVQAAIILVVAWTLNWLVRRALDRLCARYEFERAFAIGTRRVLGIIIYTAAFLGIMQLLGVSGSVLWGTLTGFIAVAAVAFFAAWS